MKSSPESAVTFLFTDIEGSTGLWERQPAQMQPALARHDALVNSAVAAHRGTLVKLLGDGAHAVFDDAADALAAALQLQQALADDVATRSVPLRVRCGLHAGTAERRDDDFFGGAVNRAARIMGAAHGGQVLASQAVADAAGDRLPPGASLRDLGAVRLRDLSRPERLYQVDHPRLRSSFPPLRSLEATPNNLPSQMSSFVGRERAMDEVRKLLGTTRLLTLSGMGGLGKTRLALQVAAAVLDDCADGVWFVELAPVADPRLVPQAAASVLGVKEEAGRPVLEALTRHVADRQMLLILDNCEHLIGACAALAQTLLAAGPRLKVLASSREPLRVTGELAYPVAPLALPDPSRATAPPDLLQYGAVRLFVDRAQAVQPAFRVTTETGPALADICQRLDGIPLAIELAAARVNVLPVEKIADRLSDRFRLLSRGSRTALPRQQTLRALIDWSFDLLDGDERALFARLAVFVGGFTLEAVQAISGCDPGQGADVLDRLAALVEKSLVELDAGGQRYRQLETVREYAREKLEESGEAGVVRSRHLDFYAAYAKRAHPELWGPQQGQWLARLDLERENFLAAATWCDRAEDGAGRGLRLVYALQLYWLPRGLLELGYRLTVEALARPGAERRDLDRCGALYAASQLAYFLGAFADSRRHGDAAVALAREHGARERAAAALLLCGYASDALGRRDEAQAQFEESAALARELGDKGRLSFALNALAGHHAEVDDVDRAVPLFEEALALTRELGDQESVAIHLSNLARVLVDRGEAERVRTLLAESLAIGRAIGSRRAEHNVVEVAAGLASLTSEWLCAARFFGAVEAQLQEIGMHRTPADEAVVTRRMARARVALGDAAFAEAETPGRAAAFADVLDETSAWLGNAA